MARDSRFNIRSDHSLSNTVAVAIAISQAPDLESKLLQLCGLTSGARNRCCDELRNARATACYHQTAKLQLEASVTTDALYITFKMLTEMPTLLGRVR